MRVVAALITALILSGCMKNEVVDCHLLTQGYLDENVTVVKGEIGMHVVDKYPQPTSEDELGHYQNFIELIGTLNDQCPDLIYTLVCYACIETYPLQTEIRVQINGESRNIDIRTPEDDHLEIVRVHE